MTIGNIGFQLLSFYFCTHKSQAHMYLMNTSNRMLVPFGGEAAGFDTVNSAFQPDTLLSITWSQVSVVYIRQTIPCTMNGIAHLAYYMACN